MLVYHRIKAQYTKRERLRTFRTVLAVNPRRVWKAEERRAEERGTKKRSETE